MQPSPGSRAEGLAALGKLKTYPACGSCRRPRKRVSENGGARSRDTISITGTDIFSKRMLFLNAIIFTRKVGLDEKRGRGHRARAINALLPSILMRGRETQTKFNDVRITNSGVHTRRTFYNAHLTIFLKALARPRVAETLERQNFRRRQTTFLIF